MLGVQRAGQIKHNQETRFHLLFMLFQVQNWNLLVTLFLEIYCFNQKELAYDIILYFVNLKTQAEFFIKCRYKVIQIFIIIIIFWKLAKSS